MAKKSAPSDRQAVIEQLRKEQRGAERRRGLAIVSVSVLIAVLMVGAAAYQPLRNWWDGRQVAALSLEELGAPASACQEIVTKDADGNQDHLPTGTPVEYQDTPPAFGAHWNEPGVAPAPMSRKFYTAEDRPALESLVHNLEHGYTIVWYDETIAADADALSTLRGLASKFAGTSNMRDKLIVAPWTSQDEGGKPFPDGQHIAFTHWSAGNADNGNKQLGVWQYCSAPSGAALADFVLAYPYLDSPEPNAM